MRRREFGGPVEEVVQAVWNPAHSVHLHPALLPHTQTASAPSQQSSCRPKNFCVPSSQRELQKSVARTIALSFLLPKRDQPWKPSERAVITSSFVGNGISMAHGRAWRWGLAARMVMVMAGKNCSGMLSPSTWPGSEHWREWVGGELGEAVGRVCSVASDGCKERKMELAPSRCTEAWLPLPALDSAHQRSLGPETPEIALSE